VFLPCPSVRPAGGLRLVLCGALLVLAPLATACRSSATGRDAGAAPAASPIEVSTLKVAEQPVRRVIRVTGALAAQEQAQVAAEIAGRVVATPVERGTSVAAGSDLIRISADEVQAQANEAEANAAQIQARLGQPEGAGFEIDRVPEVAVARSSYDLAKADFDRVQLLYDRKLVSQAEFDLRRAQAENARRQYESARNGAEQQRQALAAAQARVALAKKALGDTVVRAPFAGVVGERLVSVGDYVTRGTRVASVLRVTPLRVQLTVPAQYISSVAVGRTVTLDVDAYPGRTFTGQVRYVSPAVQADTRALIVEAVVANEKGELKPGLFVTARVDEAEPTPGLVVPAAAVRTLSGTSRVFALAGDHVEERIVTTGQTIGDDVEIATGLAAGDVIATSNLAQLADGVRVTAK
jgi:multidrug efflux pump subunit AcrA (membrane-fusion protein)